MWGEGLLNQISSLDTTYNSFGYCRLWNGKVLAGEGVEYAYDKREICIWKAD